MTEPIPLTRHDLEAKIVKHSWEDEGFRKEFVADPVGTFVNYLHMPASSLPKIVVHEELSNAWHIVLPAKPADIGELSEEELEKVAGGVTPTVVATVASGVIASLATAVVSGAAATPLKDSGW
jgi:hypothetical protein